jgi:hypothetical protein
MKMFHDQGKGVVFMETVINIRAHRHAVIEAIPLPYGDYEDAPAYFKEAIMVSAEEWSQHKKVIDTSETTCLISMSGLVLIRVMVMSLRIQRSSPIGLVKRSSLVCWILVQSFGESQNITMQARTINANRLSLSSGKSGIGLPLCKNNEIYL